MIVLSDNTATNLLLDRFTADSVNAEMDALGLKDTRCLRKILSDGKACCWRAWRSMKTNATRILDNLGIAYQLREYGVDPGRSERGDRGGENWTPG